MKNVKNILDLILQPNKNEDTWKIHLIKHWPTIIGHLHHKVSLHKIHKTSVTLGVYDSSWIQELYLLSNIILKKINDHLNEPKIISLRFQCIEKQNHKKHQYHQVPLKKMITLKQHEQKALDQIKDPQLSAALQGFLERCLQ